MKIKTLAVLMTALSIGVSPVTLMSASAQDAPIIKKKGTAQTDQSGGQTQQQPDAGSATDGGSSGSGSGAATGGQQAQQPATGSDGSASGTSSDSTSQTQTKSGSANGGSTQSGTSDGSKAGTSQRGDASGTGGAKSKSTTESQKSGAQDTGAASSETQRSGTDATTSGGSSDPQTNSKTNVENHDTTVNKTNVNISVEQQTEIRQVVKEVHIEPVREVDFTVLVGTRIPKKIRLEPLPPRIVKIVPQYESYRFFILADGRIVIVDPAEFTVVYIVTV